MFPGPAVDDVGEDDDERRKRPCWGHAMRQHTFIRVPVPIAEEGCGRGKKGIRKTVVRVCVLGRWRCFDSAMVEEVRGSFSLLCRCKSSLVQESKIESYTSFVKSCSRREVFFFGVVNGESHDVVKMLNSEGRKCPFINSGPTPCDKPVTCLSVRPFAPWRKVRTQGVS